MDRNLTFSGGKTAYICLAFGGIFSDVCGLNMSSAFNYGVLPNSPGNETASPNGRAFDPSLQAKGAFSRRGPRNHRLPSEVQKILDAQTPMPVPTGQNPPGQVSGATPLALRPPAPAAKISDTPTPFDSIITLTHESPTPLTSQQNQFAEDFLGFPQLKLGAHVSKGRELGRGAYGRVSAGSLDGQDIVIKEGLSEQGREDMQKEFENSKAILSSVMQNLGRENPEFGLTYGIGAIAPVLAATENGRLIQIEIPGATLEKTATEGRTPYDTTGCFPNNPQEAVVCASALPSALVALHHAGFVHGDIKPDNVMITKNPAGSHSAALLDLGLTTKIGKLLSACSSNGAPEYVLLFYKIVEIQSQISDFESKLSLVSQQIEDLKRKNFISLKNFTPIIAQQLKALQAQEDTSTLPEKLDSMCEPLKEAERKRTYASKAPIDPKVPEKLWQLTERQEFLTFAIQALEKAQQSIVIPPAHPSYDIYASTPVFLAALFGKAGLDLGQELFFHNPDRPIKFQYVHDARQPGFDGYTYFLRILTDLSQRMFEATGRRFPEPILQRLARLFAGMTNLDPTQRPSAVDVTEAFTDFGLSDWKHGFYFIRR
ncbi:MAG: hypothetical protein LBJ81_02275 [Puniceicoccales bacterium]|jgi:serine/threonine protein kinase|nr:hypothetical protein [Puniceicoccales bacterium]